MKMANKRHIEVDQLYYTLNLNNENKGIRNTINTGSLFRKTLYGSANNSTDYRLKNTYTKKK